MCLTQFRFTVSIRNARDDILHGIGDFALSLYDSLLNNEALPQRQALEMKMPSIKEFVKLIKEKHFSALKLCKLIDTSLKHNVSSIAELHRFLNFCFKSTDQTLADLIENIGCMGGNAEDRVNMMCSNNELLEFRRLLEAVANYLIGGTRSTDYKGAKVS